MTRYSHTQILVAAFTIALAGTLLAQSPDEGDLGGVVRSAAGPEAGVWVIAETDDLDTRLRKIVVTDEEGRFLLPDLPAASYQVWVRGYGLVDSAKVTGQPGQTLALQAVQARSPQEAAQVGAKYWEAPLSDALSPIGAVMLDLGCDRKCDFCQTPTYQVGYTAMSPERAHAWLRMQRAQGARSVIVLSDQFLGRVLWPGGRADVLEIMRSFRALDVAILWGNGLEISKATRGRGLRGGDPTPDDELVQALWGWDGRRGCAQAYIPAERPVSGPEAYEKLLAWRHHVVMLEAIVRAGVPDITYGLIVGLPEDSHGGLLALERSVGELRQRLKSINPDLTFRVVPYAIRPLAGTPQADSLEQLGLLRFRDSAICGGFWTACADTRYMSYADVSEWQSRLMHGLSDNEADFQGITAIA